MNHQQLDLLQQAIAVLLDDQPELLKLANQAIKQHRVKLCLGDCDYV